MKKNLQNEELDRIGSELLKAARLPEEEVEKIAVAPHLFGSVKTRIEMKRSHRESNGWANIAVWKWQKAGIAFGVVAAFVVGAFGLLMLNQKSSPDTAKEISPLTEPGSTSRVKEIITEPATTSVTAVKAKITVQRTSLKNTSAVKVRAAKRQPRFEREEVSEYYALTYTGEMQAGDDGQIIRVELPRASLFAMGIDIPVENAAAKIKADLLVGPDGVMKAVRLVN
jgi:hypothetical protein